MILSYTPFKSLYVTHFVVKWFSNGIKIPQNTINQRNTVSVYYNIFIYRDKITISSTQLTYEGCETFPGRIGLAYSLILIRYCKSYTVYLTW